MSILAQQPDRFDRALAATPLVGPLSRAIGRDVSLVFYLLAILATLVVLAVQSFGLAALVMAYLCLVPLMFAFFIAVTLP